MRIKFKDSKDVDFNKIFPVIDEKEYKLLSNQELIITEQEVKKVKENKYLSMSGKHISSQLFTMLEKTIDHEQEAIQKIVNDKFIFVDDMVDILFAGIQANKNVILWGRGGHGKSEVTELVFNELYKAELIDELPFIQAFGDGLTEEKLFGGMNIKKYKEEGKIEYLPENSFMSKKYVIFEEIFDAPASVLLSLKDIMTSKKFRQGNEVYDVKTELIIGLTNKSKTEFAEKDESLKALAERFPLTLNVEWNNYSKSNFIKLFNKVLGEDVYKQNSNKLSELANILDLNNSGGSTFVSPRTAVAAADLHLRGKKLEYISEIDPDIIKEYNKKKRDTKFNALFENLLNNIDSYIDQNDLSTVDQNEEFLEHLSKVEEEIGGDPIETNFNDENSIKKKKIKIAKAKYILNIIDRIGNTEGEQRKQFSQLKARLNEIIQLSQIDLQEIEDEEEVTNIQF